MITIPVTMETSGVATGMERINQQVSSLKSGGVANTFKSLASDLAMANSPAEMLSVTMNRLSIAMKSTILGAAGLAIGKLLAAPFEQLSAILKESSGLMEQSINQLERAGPALSLQQGVAEANSMQQSIDSIQNSISKIDGNIFLKLASAITGSRDELEKMAQSLERVSNSRILQGIQAESSTQAFRMGLSPDDQRLFDISERTRTRVQQVRAATTPGAEQDAAVLEAFNIGARERNATLDQMIAERAKKEFNEKEKLAKAYAELVQGFDETLSNRRRRKDQEEHDDKMKKINELLAKPIERPVAEPARRSSFEVLTDSLRKVGGGGTFAQVGGTESVQKDQLTVLKNIEKNTARTGSGSVTPVGVE